MFLIKPDTKASELVKIKYLSEMNAVSTPNHTLGTISSHDARGDHSCQGTVRERHSHSLSAAPVQVLKLARHCRYVAVAACIGTVLSCNEGIVEKSQKLVNILTGAHGSKTGSYDSRYEYVSGVLKCKIRRTADKKSPTLWAARL